MLGLHPFLDVAVARVRRRVLDIRLDLCISIQIVLEMLQECDLFLQFSLGRVVAQFVRSYGVGLVSLFLLDVLEVLTVLVDDYLGGVIEVNTCGAVRKEIA